MTHVIIMVSKLIINERVIDYISFLKLRLTVLYPIPCIKKLLNLFIKVKKFVRSNESFVSKVILKKHKAVKMLFFFYLMTG